MQEIELKFLVPESRLKGLMRQAKVKSSQITQLAAHYYDTPDQKLAQAGIGLRIRKEGDTWVQTIKAGGDGIAARLEHNAVLDNEQVQEMLDNNALMPDLTLYQDTSVAPALADFKLKKLAKKLTRLYVTDVERTTRVLVADDDANNCIEMAYDYGQIIHGNDETQRDRIQEIEFELLSGDVDFLFDTAKTWCKRYKLCLSTVTKAERGGLLITDQPHSPAVSADFNQLTINKHSSLPAFVRSAVHHCLLQILPNSSAIAAGSEDDAHVWQLYIGMCRLQAVLTACDTFSDEINPEWLPIVAQTLMLLEDYHHFTYLITRIEPSLQAQGAPATDWHTDNSGNSDNEAIKEAKKVTPIDTVSANDLQLTLLELIAFTMSDPSLEPNADTQARDKLAKVLSQLHTQLISAVQTLNEQKNDTTKAEHLQALRHIRHRINHLHYMSEFAAPSLYKKQPQKKIKHGLKPLLKVQKALNQYLNHAYYQHTYQKQSVTDTRALYGAGWFAGQLPTKYKTCQKRLDKILNRPSKFDPLS